MKSICKAKIPNSRLRSASGGTGVSPGMANYSLGGREEHEPDALARASLARRVGVAFGNFLKVADGQAVVANRQSVQSFYVDGGWDGPDTAVPQNELANTRVVAA